MLGISLLKTPTAVVDKGSKSYSISSSSHSKCSNTKTAKCTKRKKDNGKDALILRRLEDLLHEPNNQTCADCHSDSPTWASLVAVDTASSGSKGANNNQHKIGVFCCHKCVSYHYELGRELCAVKNTKKAKDCTYY